jgi:hypothetical protein
VLLRDRNVFGLILVLVLANACMIMPPLILEDAELSKQKSVTPKPSELPTEAEYAAVKSYDFRKIDRHALDAPKTAEASIESLAAYLTAGAANELEKVRAIYRWITANIAYDTKMLLSGRLFDEKAPSVLSSRDAVCAGYSRLFVALAKEAGIEAILIFGCEKRGLVVINSRRNHAWNAVKIEGKWWLIEATAGSGHFDEKFEFTRRFSEFYFLPHPEDLGFNHLPEVEAWQLKEDVIDWDEFLRLIEPDNRLFEYGIRAESLPSRYKRFEAERFLDFTLPVAEGIELSGDLFTKKGNKLTRMNKYASFKRVDSKGIRLSATFPGSGEYILWLYGRRQGEEQYVRLIEYEIVVK